MTPTDDRQTEKTPLDLEAIEANQKIADHGLWFDSDFVRFSRVHLPLLIAEVRRLQAELRVTSDDLRVMRAEFDKATFDRTDLRTAITTAMDAAEAEDCYRHRGTDDEREFYRILREAVEG